MNKKDYELIKKLINSNTEYSLTSRNEAMDKLDKYLNESISYDTAQEYGEYCFSATKRGMLPIAINIFVKKPKWKYKPSKRIGK
tara:strand:- start:1556 stop:1807 length:252 start_codon:yes stop_codon:yes gene_type:complete